MKRQFDQAISMLHFHTMPHWGRGYGISAPLRATNCFKSLHHTRHSFLHTSPPISANSQLFKPCNSVVMAFTILDSTWFLRYPKE